ncbi:MAG: DUF4861 family protein, partial [Kiritimatiellae bacterium]|nr:DUF4861 family protein [Kiritimatiellia bacterium]
LALAVSAAALTLFAAAAAPEEKELAAALPAAFARAADQYRLLTEQMKAGNGRHPKSFANGKLVTIPPEDWCSGFYPGSLWFLYEYTKDPFWKAEAEKATEIQEKVRHYNGNHDIGFMLMSSVGQALRLGAGTPQRKRRYEEILHDGAAALATRYTDKMKLIRSWGKIGDERSYLVIVDNMMNLELLEWDAKRGGAARSAEIAKNHADMTDGHHFRADGSAFHVLNYNQKTPGKILEYRSGQGACASGAWSRGHSWAIYGFTMMHRETKNPRYLERAIRAADYAINHPNMPADGIPYWDYHAANIPDEERDSSAGAIMASALLELSALAPAAKAAAYRAFAVRQLRALISDGYFAKRGEIGGFLLKHGVGSKPQFIQGGKGGEVDVPLNYADYYLLEALLRFKALTEQPEAASAARVDARHVPERMDDFVWENDFCGMRAYGPKVSEPRPAGEGLVSSGFDVFNKAVPDVMMAETLIRGVKEKISYHQNNGRGFDNYKVSTGRGCGGVGRMTEDGWRYARNWRTQRVLEKSGQKAVFELGYEAYTIRGTVTAGAPFTRFDVLPRTGASGKPAAGRDLMGPGLDVSADRRHDGTLKIDLKRGFVANFEPFGVDGDGNGNVMTAILLDPACGPAHLASDETGCLHLLQRGNVFTYYAGAAWSGAGRFTTPDEWFAYVKDFADSLAQ